ncbi:MAG: hypothetical protein FWE32_07185 [Oscillospiraceae bacterium]|nr:hypothetical protein [Oscillospiraceae bacterium]
MTFAEKLDFLLGLTNTKNSSIARYTSLDPSYVSRLRRGERCLPKNDSNIELMANYLADKCKTVPQLSTLRTVIKNEAINNQITAEKLSQVLLVWFRDSPFEKSTTVSNVSNILTDLTWLSVSSPYPASKNEVMVYYGVEGKQQATIALFNMMLSQEKPGTLLLYSDESTEWMIENPTYYNTWQSLLSQIIRQGNVIKVIHKVSRDIDEMLGVIRLWLPFYITGAVQPYYYPKLRDGVYKRSLTIAPGVASIVSTSVGDATDNAANLMMTDTPTVNSFKEEFYSYLALCKPLLNIFSAARQENALATIRQFGHSHLPSIEKSTGLPIITMPPPLFKKICAREGLADSFFETFTQLNKNFHEKLKHTSVCNIFNLPLDLDTVSHLLMQGSTFFAGKPVYYTKTEYLAHLENMIKLSAYYENYEIVPLSGGVEENYSLTVVEEMGVVVLNEENPPVIFEISETNMTAAFWDYLISVRAGAKRADLSGQLDKLLKGCCGML